VTLKVGQGHPSALNKICSCDLGIRSRSPISKLIQDTVEESDCTKFGDFVMSVTQVIVFTENNYKNEKDLLLLP